MQFVKEKDTLIKILKNLTAQKKKKCHLNFNLQAAFYFPNYYLDKSI